MHDDLIYAPIPEKRAASSSPIRPTSGRLDVVYVRGVGETLIYIKGILVGKNPHTTNTKGNKELRDHSSGKVWEYYTHSDMVRALREFFKLHGLDFDKIRNQIVVQ